MRTPAPHFDGVENWLVYEDQPIVFLAAASDGDYPEYAPPFRADDGSLLWLEGIAAPLDYEAMNLPGGSIFDSDTTEFAWMPGYDDAGEYSVTFTATDDGDGTGVPLVGSETAQITVLNVNRPPEMPVIDNQMVNGGDVLILPITVTDPDGNPLQLVATNALPGYPLPDFITFADLGGGQGQFHIAPDPEDRGDYTIILTATDNGDGGGWVEQQSASQTFVVSVEAGNIPPRFDYVGDAVAVVGDLLCADTTSTRRGLRAADVFHERSATGGDIDTRGRLWHRGARVDSRGC